MGEEVDTNEGNKRKLEEGIQLAKQKAQEIAARLVSDAAAESKRPRLDSSTEHPANSYSYPPLQSTFGQYYNSPVTCKKVSIPNGKVGVIIGKGGETIKYLQTQSGAKIQITKDSEADPYSLTREVELTGTSEQISRAEQLITEVIAETDSGGSAPTVNRILQPGVEQIVVKVPNNKVALIIGKGGETIKTMQNRSGARMQVVPLHLPPGDTSMERNLYINGTKEQIDSAQEMVNEIIRENRLRVPPVSTSYLQQPAYSTAATWAPPGQPSYQQPPQQPSYAYYSTAPPAPYYDGYSAQQEAGWDQSNPLPQQSTGYDSYSQQSQTQPNPPNISQTPPVPTYSYAQGYTQQQPAANYPPQDFSNQQQTPYPAPGYGQAVGQSSQPDSTAPYPVPYGQPNYSAPPSYSAPPPVQGGYCQMAYGGAQPPVPPSQPLYGQSAYPAPAPAPAPGSYVQGTNPGFYMQPPPQNQSQPLGYGGDAAPASGAAPQESSVRPQS